MAYIGQPEPKRVQVGEGPQDESLQAPSGGLVDTFVRPAQEDSTTQLARALGNLSPEVGRLGDLLAQKQEQDQQIKGAVDANTLEKNRTDYKTAVSKGLIQPNESPWYQYSLNKETGRLTAEKYKGDLAFAVQADPLLSKSTDVADFDKFEAGFRKQWEEKNIGGASTTPAFEQGYEQLANAHVNDMRDTFAKQAGENARTQGLDVHTTRVINTVVSEMARGVDPKIIAGEIGQQTTAWILNGGQGDKFNKATIDGVIEAARYLGSPGLARQILSDVPGGPKGSKLALTGYGVDSIVKAEQEIGNEVASKARAENEAADRAKAKNLESTFSGAASALSAANDPATVDLSPYRDALIKGGHSDKVDTLYAMQAAFSNRVYEDDPNVKASAFMQVYGMDESTPGHFLDKSDTSRMLAARQISVATYNELNSKIDEEDKSGRVKSSAILNDPYLKSGISDLEDQFKKEFGFENTTMTTRAKNAKGALINNYIDWKAAHPDASPKEINTYFQNERPVLFNHFSDKSNVQDVSKIPTAQSGFNLGPQPVDPNKQLVTDPSNIHLLQAEYEQWASGHRHELSDYSKHILYDAGIPLDKKSVGDFLRVQGHLALGIVPPTPQPDSTNNP